MGPRVTGAQENSPAKGRGSASLGVSHNGGGRAVAPAAGPAFRLQGWESRLAAIVEAARSTPYKLGEHDCFRFACAAVEALTGADIWTTWAGRYRTRREALRRIHEFGGGGFTEAATRLFGGPLVHPGLARRGDVLEYEDAAREQHLGVCVGAHVAVLKDSGLAFVPLHECRHGWRVG